MQRNEIRILLHLWMLRQEKSSIAMVRRMED